MAWHQGSCVRPGTEAALEHGAIRTQRWRDAKAEAVVPAVPDAGTEAALEHGVIRTQRYQNTAMASANSNGKHEY